MDKTLKQTKEFMLAGGQTVRQYPCGPPTIEERKLRLSLELEELYEKAQAFGLEKTFCAMMNETQNKKTSWWRAEDDTGIFGIAPDTLQYDTVAVLDACADQRVVADGTILACGLQDVFEQAMDEVSRSNMSKFAERVGEAMLTVVAHEKLGKLSYYEPTPDKLKFVIKRHSDGKILKSISYSPPNLESILRQVEDDAALSRAEG